ncbi:LysM domain-containing protein [Patescibacteria group bacterium]|nr:LysM domain-containing protein [Patescibacteria group bacterium]
MTTPNRNKLAFYYFMSAIVLFALGYGLAWFSEQTFFAQDVFPKQEQEVKATASPNAGEETVKNGKKASSKPGQQYTVKQGDTISTIAEKNGTTVDAVATYNDIPEPYNLTPGQVIIIPPAK